MTTSYQYKIPLFYDEAGNIELAHLELPKRNLSEKEWRKMLYILEQFKPGIVKAEEPKEAEFVEER